MKPHEIDPKTKERLLKIFSLSQHGVGGERVNAEKMLQEALSRLNISIDDLNDSNKTVMVWIKYNSIIERKLLTQIQYCVIGDVDCKFFTSQSRKRHLGFDVTPSQASEMMVMFDAYSKALKKEYDNFYQAFIQANRIFPTTTKPNDRKFTEEELRRQKKVLNMAMGIDRVSIRKQIEN